MTIDQQFKIFIDVIFLFLVVVVSIIIALSGQK